LIYLLCKRCKHYWEDLKYCPKNKIFLPKEPCEKFEEDEEKNVDKYREEIV